MNMRNTGAVNMLGMGREKERERERGGGEQGEEREVASISPLDHLTFFFFFFAMNSPADNRISSFQQL